MAVDFGKYQLLRKIGSGGMGQVFLARAAGAEGFEKLLVVKRLLPHLAEDEEFVSMFFEEARITARLNHPNLVQIFELGQAGTAHYLAMEYVAGEDLRRVDRYARAQSRPLPLDAACRIIADAAGGLDYAHKARDPQGKPLGLVHRDVSPQNILVGFDGAVKLIDFGVAKAAGRAQNTASGVLKGKYSYMSPEQSLGLDLDARSDIFALGVVFWELLTGKRLFKGENELVTMRLVSDCLIPPPTKLNPLLPSAIDDLVLGALQKNPAKRFADAAAFGMAIEEFARSNRLAASTAHLGALLHELYKESIARELNVELLDELQGLPPDSETSAPSASSFRPGASKERPALPSRSPAPRGLTTVSDAHERRKRRLTGALWGSLAALVLVFGAAGAVVRVRRATRKADIAELPLSSPTTMGDVRTPSTQRTSDYVRLMLITNPTGANVEIDGKPMGQTPLTYEVLPTASPVVAQFSLEGFESETMPLSAKQAPTVSLVLKRKLRAKHPGPSLGIKTGR